MAEIPPPPLTSALAQEDGKAAPTWARWLQELWTSARASAAGTGTTTPAATVTAFRAFAQVTDNWNGAPASKTSAAFTTNGGTLLIFANSGAYRDATIGLVGFYIDVDTTEVGRMAVFTNEIVSHKACVPACILAAGIAAGSHTIRVRQFAGQLVNADDPLDVLVVELPL